MKKILAILLILCCALPVMAKKRQNEEIITPLSQLEKRQFQTKTYSASDNLLAMKAILNVLQDEGFIVYNVNSLLGYIYGVKDFDTSDPNVDISKEFGLTKSRLNYNGVKVATLEVSVNITEYGEQARIRANFKRKLFNEYGNAQMIDDIDEAEFYADFYQKVDAAILLQKEIAEKVKKQEPPVSIRKPVTKSKTQAKRPIQKTAPAVIEEPETTKSNAPEIRDPEQAPSQSAVSESEKVQKPEIKEEVRTDTSAKPAEVQEVKSEEVKTEEVKQSETGVKPTAEKQTIKEQKPETKASEPTPEQILDLVPVDSEPVRVMTSKEETKALKELVKQAKAEAKQAQKEALQAQKEAMQLQKDLDKEAQRAEKEAQKEAKRQAKEMRE